MEVVIRCSPASSLSSCKPTNRVGKGRVKSDEEDEDEDDSELLIEPEYSHLQRIHAGSISKRSIPIRKCIKFDSLIKQKTANSILIENLSQIEKKEEEITMSILEISQHSELLSNSNIVKTELQKELQSEDSIYTAILRKYDAEYDFSKEIPAEASSFRSLSLLSSQSDWGSVKTKFLLSSSSQCIPKNILSGMDFYTWLSNNISIYFETPNFVLKLAISGSILKLPFLEKSLLLNLQRSLIHPFLLSFFKKDVYSKSLDLSDDSFLLEFYTPIAIFKTADSTHTHSFYLVSNPEFLANFTVYLQSHIHIVHYILEHNYISKTSGDKFMAFVTDKPRSSLDIAKNELACFLKALACRLKPGSFIPLQEVILNYESLLLK
ncbi:hypothetical protein MDAP_001591 [Mitosporidium daphniae]|uniref:Uncharacterized protein n=1 Tax=Mitosporidium daphniae TaxID=1485682 RepID=A0A098VNV0_9MICR|nr:uncharacterized protein DI09_60p120 [Mitosporidium daphniae]KGG50645.1 hypothetical protein DI09_60p120 [Mitosporidium daphniae]|eukprot:XP_013237072.1 uncharacterized protein DI09_60p120 [Mitosporidium daphniae]